MGEVFLFAPRAKEIKSMNKKNINSGFCQISMEGLKNEKTEDLIVIKIRFYNEKIGEKEFEFMNKLRNNMQYVLSNYGGVEFDGWNWRDRFFSLEIYSTMFNQVMKKTLPILRKVGLAPENIEIISCFHGSVHWE